MNLERKIERINKYKLALVEVDALIEASDKAERQKISSKFIKFIKEKKDKMYKFNVDTSKKLSEQNLMRETKIILSLIYRSYFCTIEERKELALKDKKTKEEKYNPDNIFNARLKRFEQQADNTEKTENMQLMKKDEERWYKIIYNKLLACFKKIFKIE